VVTVKAGFRSDDIYGSDVRYSCMTSTTVLLYWLELQNGGRS
jgi:hypothetical protein